MNTLQITAISHEELQAMIAGVVASILSEYEMIQELTQKHTS